MAAFSQDAAPIATFEFTPVLSLTIIVPRRGDAEPFEDTLVSILQNRPPRSEVVVVTAGEYDDPYGLAEEVNFVAAAHGAGLVEQINLAVRESRGEVLHILQCGVVVEEEWTVAALAHFKTPEVGSVAPGIRDVSRSGIMTGVRAAASGRRIEVRRSGAENHAPHCQGPSLLAGFWRRAAWDRAGGLDPRLEAEYAELDLGLALQTLGYRCVAEPASQVMQRTLPNASISAWSEGRAAETVFWKHARQLGRGAWMLHALGLAGEFLGAIPRPRRAIEFLARVSVLSGAARGSSKSSAAPQSHRPNKSADEPVRRREGVKVGLERECRTPARNAVQPY